MDPIVLRVLALVVIFASVFLVSERVIATLRQRQRGSRAINKRLKMIEGGLDREIVTSRLRKSAPGSFTDMSGIIGKIGRSIERAVVASGIPLPPHQIMLGMAIASTAVAGLILLSAGIAGFGIGLGVIQLSIALGFCFGGAIPMMVLSHLASKRRKKMQEQFPVALDIFVRGLRSGHPIASALDLLTKEMEDPLGTEFGLVVDEVSYGADMRDALQNMADRWGIDDIQMFVVSLSVQNETGGNLAEILANLSAVIRDRHTMYMKVRALSSEGRMTALILTALPIMTFSGLFMINPSFYIDVAQDPIFPIG
ncbi:type II secretion system F family protein, partial [Sphingorhabdus sp.]|uniref:type II secretion system F family protein n=1 Tax=Sphingorhabdus sp. TaxID=1902408 RepID=UPI0032B781C8